MTESKSADNSAGNLKLVC